MRFTDSEFKLWAPNSADDDAHSTTFTSVSAAAATVFGTLSLSPFAKASCIRISHIS